MDEKESPMKFSTGGVFKSAERLAQAITSLEKVHNLIVPGGAISAEMPLLHAAGMSFVFVDLEKETYPIVGKSERGMGKTALDRIAAAAGVHWNPHLCGRVDDSSSPYVVEYQAAGTYLQLDGTESMIHASKRIDLRAERNTPAETWGADAAEIARIAARENREPWPQILQQRQHILSLAESKAKNRAIRSLGVRTAYTPADLAKGFLVLRLQFTGRSDDPAVEREVSMMIARRALSSQAALYGSADHEKLPAGPLARVPRLAVKEEPDDEESSGSKKPNGGADPAKATVSAAAAAAPLAGNAEPNPPAENPSLICGKQNDDGSWPRKPCSQLTVAELKAKIAAYEKKQPTWDEKWIDKNMAELKAMKAWLAFKEFDPRQAELGLGGKPKSDTVPF